LNCNEMKSLIHPYVDGELDLVRNLEIEQHLQACAACAQASKNQQTLRTALSAGSLRFEAPAGLQKRIQASLQRATRPARPFFPVPWRGLAVAASLLVVALGTWSLARISWIPPANDLLAREVVSSHFRSLHSREPVAVLSSNQHTVKPWFADKLDFSPPVKDLTGQGFPLIGARVDYLDDRLVAALLYGRQQHKITLYVWPSAQNAAVAATTETRQGFHLIHWADSGMTFWAISDLNTTELQQFVQLIQK
jgi:anti-sigma factor RsiW